MVALNPEAPWPDDHKRRERDKLKLIKLIRELKPQSTSREIDDEEPATYDRNRLRDECGRDTDK